ncbi:hypothetical protein NTE_01220 [Candidatus Nitrososphaera evergladensis SR1]|uniref:Uncharacterized protein n=1 Tax=Candidatus Nitrososphaera evergladensis SR1 TaxID=1459636 RepID=A0A075MR50_9ARCH|nr:hypothetical protein [Candidatus Nitrososphaera evergladensis]AIF83292.1 hypothetical protein NTE_01220 [Candidatus Nitrososphaera evergladensis SR1]
MVRGIRMGRPRKKKQEKRTFTLTEWERIRREMPSFDEQELKEFFDFPRIVADPKMDSGYL